MDTPQTLLDILENIRTCSVSNLDMLVCLPFFGENFVNQAETGEPSSMDRVVEFYFKNFRSPIYNLV